MSTDKEPTKKPCGHCGKPRASNAPWSFATMPTRPSCMECVEKHLGAAYVLLSEARDGYGFAYRMRAIGHLHEAEDESQEWPPLHDAIRAARRGYQGDGVMPNWDMLGDLCTRLASASGDADQPDAAQVEAVIPGRTQDDAADYTLER